MGGLKWILWTLVAANALPSLLNAQVGDILVGVCVDVSSEPEPNERLASLSLEEFRAMRDDPKRLASVRFPLPDDDFEVEIESYLRVLSAKLSNFRDVKFPNGAVDHAQVERCIRLAGRLRHPRLRGPLIHVLQVSERYRKAAAIALLKWRDPDLRREVERFRHHPCKIMIQLGNEVNGTIGDLIGPPREISHKPKIRRTLHLLPPSEPRGVEFDEARAGLLSVDLSIRLQSWKWLAQRGMVAATDPVEEAWEELSESQQRSLVVRGSIVGVERLRTLYESLIRQENFTLADQSLLVRLGELKSRYGVRLAKRIVISPHVYPESFWLHAVESLIAHPTAADLPCLFELLCRVDKKLRPRIWRGLVGVSDPRALTVLQYAFRSVEFEEMRPAVWRLSEIARERLELRWRYLGFLAALLRSQPFEIEGRTPSLIRAFHNAVGAKLTPIAFHVSAGYSRSEVLEARDRCLEWYETYRPSRGAVPAMTAPGGLGESFPVLWSARSKSDAPACVP
ncbi:MAG: hypothetical protein AAF488_18670, partial [Planctomycetota bacterium]